MTSTPTSTKDKKEDKNLEISNLRMYDTEALVQSGAPKSTMEAILSDASKVQSNYNQKIEDPDLYIPGQRLQHGMTVFLYGPIGTWKTSWSATWPKPVFLSIGQEGGDDSLISIPHLYGLPIPRAYNIDSVSKMQDKVEFIANNYVAMDINTVVIDSVTSYIDLWMFDLLKGRVEKVVGKGRSNVQYLRLIEEGGVYIAQRDWGTLDGHLKLLAMLLHSTKLNVIWIAGQKEEKQKDSNGEDRIREITPRIPGSQKEKLPHICKMVIYAARGLKPDMNAPGRSYVQPTYFTAPTNKTAEVRHKYAAAFPEGKLVDPNLGDYPTFNAIYARIGNFIYAT